MYPRAFANVYMQSHHHTVSMLFTMCCFAGHLHPNSAMTSMTSTNVDDPVGNNCTRASLNQIPPTHMFYVHEVELVDKVGF